MKGIFSWLGVLVGIAILVAAFAFHEDETAGGYLITQIHGTAWVRQSSEQEDGGPATPSSKLHLLTQQNKLKNSQWQPLEVGQYLKEGDIVKTGEADDYMDVLIKDGAAIRIKGQSLVQISERQEIDKSKTSLTQKVLKGILVSIHRGHIVGSFDKSKNPGSFEAKTPAITMGIRGTFYSIGHNSNKYVSGVSVLHGKVEVFANNDRTNKKEVSSGQKVFNLMMTHAFSNTQSMTDDDKLNMELIQKDLKESYSFADRVRLLKEQASEYNPLSVMMRFQKKLNKANMQTFQRALLQEGAFSQKLPSTLESVRLLSGDYADTWGTKYTYTKFDDNHATLISAGPDRTFQTKDDVVLEIVLQLD